MSWRQQPHDRIAEVGSVSTQKIVDVDLCGNVNVLSIRRDREHESAKENEVLLLQFMNRTVCLELDHVKDSAGTQTNTILVGYDDLTGFQASNSQIIAMNSSDGRSELDNVTPKDLFIDNGTVAISIGG